MKTSVYELVKGIAEGEIVIPDFQRDFVWDPDHVRELVVSVLGDYFIGSMLIIKGVRKKECPFKLRLFYGVKEVNKLAEVQQDVDVILDGQQRATALFYALKQPDKPLKNRKNPYKFYIDLREALKGYWDDAVIAVNKADKKGLSRLETESNIIPLPDFADIVKLSGIIAGAPNSEALLQLSEHFKMRETIYLVDLPRNTSLEKIVETFERVNRWGMVLQTFDLLTARLRKYRITLPDLWKEAQESYEFAKVDKPDFLKEVILRVIALLRGKGTKRSDLLELEHKNFKDDWKRACVMLNTAYRRLISPKEVHGYGVFSFPKWLPYTTMLVPLAAIIGFIKSKNLDDSRNYNKIDCWYWASVFSNRYDEGAVTKQETDFNMLKKWILNDERVPDFIEEFEPNRDVRLAVDKQNSATYRGVINLVVLEGALDFKNGQPPQLDENYVQDDHIFPKSIYNEHRILNRTLLTTNLKKGSAIPSTYFKEMLEKHGEDELKRILASHMIPGKALPSLLEDNIREFTKLRRTTIIKKIKQKVKIKS